MVMNIGKFSPHKSPTGADMRREKKKGNCRPCWKRE